MTPSLILWPVAAHLGLVLALYLSLTVVRQLAMRRGEAALADFRTHEREPLRGQLIANAIASQFELPTVFHPLALCLYATDQVTPVMLTLAWIFVIGRILHAGVHTLHPSVALRGAVFTINFLALIAMWAVFLGGALFGG